MSIRDLKTVWIIPSLQQGWRQWGAFFRRLAAAGTGVTVYTMVPPDDGETPPGVSLRRIAGRFRTLRGSSAGNPFGTAFAQVSPRLVGQVCRERPDVVVAVEYSLASLWAALASHIAGARLLIFTEHRPWAQLRRSPITRLWRRLLARMAHGFIVNTPEASDYVTRDLGARPARVFFAPLISPPSDQELCQVPLAVPAAPQGPVFLFVGRLIPQKGVQYLLQAARQLTAEGHPFTLWVVGDGPFRPALEEQCRLHGLADRVAFLGSVPNRSLGFFYRRADVFVLPSLQDYLSVSVQEAMRFAKPVILSPFTGSAHTFVIHGSNGFVVDPRNTPDLAACMRQFVQDPGLAPRMGERSRERIAGYTPDNAVQLLQRAMHSFVSMESWV